MRHDQNRVGPALQCFAPNAPPVSPKLNAPTEIKGKDWQVQAVRKWICSHAGRGDLLGRIDPEYERLREWELFERVRRLRMANDREAATLMPAKEHAAVIQEMTREVQRVLGKIPPAVAPLVVGVTVYEAERVLQGAINAAFEELRNGGQ